MPLHWLTPDVIVRTARIHPVIGLVALAAYLLNMAAAAGGAVLCFDPAGASSIEIASDHDHCTTAVESEHGHDAGDCWCAGCPCEDTPLTADVVTMRKDDDVRGSTSDVSTFGFVPPFAAPWHTVSRMVLADRAPPVLDRSLRQLRTVVLIV